MPMLKYLPIIFLFVTACKTSSVSQSDSMEKKDNKKTVVAKVVKETYENKAGRVINGVEDYFLEYAGERWFIKFSCGQITPAMIAPYDNKTATFKLDEKEGLWDTDEPDVQSRIGKYVCVFEILQTTP